MRCVSNDFIENNDDPGQTGMCEGYKGGESYLAERQRKRKCERESFQEKRMVWVQRTGHSYKQLTET
jgi:hypothetical protein